MSGTGPIRLGRSPLFPVGEYPQVISTRPDDRYVNLYQDDFSEEQLAALKSWQTSLGITLEPQGQPVRESAQLLFELLSTRADSKSPQGTRTLTALENVGLLTGFPAEAIRTLVSHYGPECLSGADFLWHGHPTEALVTLAPALQALGVGRVHFACSGATGQGPARAAMRLQAKATGGSFHTLGAPENQQFKMVLGPINRAFKGPELLNVVLAAAKQAEDAGRVLIVDRLGPMLAAMDPRVTDYIRRGILRPITHNSSDSLESQAVAQDVWSADLHNSAIKREEADIVGHINAQMVEQEVLGWQDTGGDGKRTRGLQELPVVLFGYGPIGQGVAQGLRQLEAPPKSVTIVDPNPAARALAVEHGYPAVATAEELGARPSEAVALVASPVTAATPQTLPMVGANVLVLSFSTGAGGVDMQGLSEKASLERELRRRATSSLEWMPSTLPDQRFHLPSSEGRGPTSVTVPLAGRSPNLHQPQMQDRMTLLPIGLALGACVCATAKGPGAHRYPESLDARLLELYRADGLGKGRPVEVNGSHPSRW